METSTPLFPCSSLAVILDFYRSLGFKVTHEQHEPYAYGAVQHGTFELHFARLTVYGSKNAFGACLVSVSDIERYHTEFSDALRSAYGKIPTAGTPRITRFREGHTRFKLFDPNGNVITYIDRREHDTSYSYGQGYQSTSDLGQALENAVFLRDTYSNDKAAARALDVALARNKDADPVERARALAARAELAVAMGEDDTAKTVRDQLAQIALSDEDRERFKDELTAAEALKRWLTRPL